MFESSLRKPFTLQLEVDKQDGRHHPFPTKLNKSNPEATACVGATVGASVVGISVGMEIVGAALGASLGESVVGETLGASLGEFVVWETLGASLGEFVVGETLGAALVDNAIVGVMGGIDVVDGLTAETVVTGASRL